MLSNNVYTLNNAHHLSTGPCTQDEPYSGSCDTQMSQYYYHMLQDRCLPFDGCHGVEDWDNSYDSLMSCRDRCMGKCRDRPILLLCLASHKYISPIFSY